MTTTLPPTVQDRLDQVTDPAAALLDEADIQLENIEAALELMVARKVKAAQVLDPAGAAERAIDELTSILEALRERLVVAP